MNKIYCYLLFILLFFVACESENSPGISNSDTIALRISLNQTFRTRVVDEDNLASEQTIKNISLFFTDPSSNAIVYKYVYTGFSLSGDYQLITLPLEPADLQVKDIYVIANYDNEATLNAVTSIDDLKDLFTPEVDKTNNLNPLNGFCMFGSLAAFDFQNDNSEIATIGLERTCAKIRVTLTFPENPELSVNNSFLITEAAKYAYVIENPSLILPLTDYFNFAAPIPLIDNGTQQYINIAYVYESSHAPGIRIYTYFNGGTEQQTFTADLPVPKRNYLYDILVEIYEDVETTRKTFPQDIAGYSYYSTVNIYNEKGHLIDTRISK